jgi:putative methyltransferase
VPTCGNFLQVDPKDSKYKDVEFILLDPSCSGSGIVGRLDHLVSDENLEEQETKGEESSRLQSLAEFQKTAILHAMKFPKVQKIVYSTCSKHVQENEDVVNFVLENSKKFELEEKVLPSWERRGLDVFPQSDRVIRTLPEQDLTIGFFVALFKRK